MKNKKPILIVSAAEGEKDALCTLFRIDGFKVQACDNGASALAVSAKKTFQAIIIDYNLPDINGADLTGKLRSRFPGAIMIGLSAALKKEDFLRAGANFFMLKPYGYDDIENVLQLKR
jgi:DNA-binding response OmpR family regulator